MEFNTSINILSVLAASITSFIFGFIWYGPLFGKTWAKENRLKYDGSGFSFDKLFYQLLTVLLTVIVLEILFIGSFYQGLCLILLVWVGFMLSNRFGSMIWMKQSWVLFFIDSIYYLANLLIIMTVLYLL